MGSSSQLAVRLSGYLNYNYCKKPIGKFIPLLAKDSLSNFNDLSNDFCSCITAAAEGSPSKLILLYCEF